MINIKTVQYTSIIVKHIFMTTIGNVIGHSIENNMDADVRFSRDKKRNSCTLIDETIKRKLTRSIIFNILILLI